MKTAWMLVVFALAGCGAAPPSGPPMIAPAMEGVWRGGTDLQRFDQPDLMQDAVVTVTLDDPARAVISGLCPGPEQVTIVGDGTELSMAGTFMCSGISTTECDAAAYVFTSMKVTLYSGVSLNIEAKGTVTGCDTTVPIRYVFDGTRAAPSEAH